ncbi:hypothetical protein [Actinomadura sp. DC4]|uniref:hypothetical protein n=1 Tax=Actinomadura sp. DC4 TaxID=3055069 RepID=UPI0025AF23C5|nr:hypothetical protein [Actinomadura sp. DC4]MDN3354192.1 hypothetical protein [Actinomadura sp. DC4]
MKVGTGSNTTVQTLLKSTDEAMTATSASSGASSGISTELTWRERRTSLSVSPSNTAETRARTRPCTSRRAVRVSTLSSADGPGQSSPARSWAVAPSSAAKYGRCRSSGNVASARFGLNRSTPVAVWSWASSASSASAPSSGVIGSIAATVGPAAPPTSDRCAS